MTTKTKIGLGVLGLIAISGIVFLAVKKPKTSNPKPLEHDEDLKQATSELKEYTQNLIKVKTLLENLEAEAKRIKPIKEEPTKKEDKITIKDEEEKN